MDTNISAAANVCANAGSNPYGATKQKGQLKDVLTLLGFKNVDQENLADLVKAINDGGLSLEKLETELKSLKLQGRISPEAFDILFGESRDGIVDKGEAQAIDCWKELELAATTAQQFQEMKTALDTKAVAQKLAQGLTLLGLPFDKEEQTQLEAVFAAFLEDLSFVDSLTMSSASSALEIISADSLHSLLQAHPDLNGPATEKLAALLTYFNGYQTEVLGPLEKLQTELYLQAWSQVNADDYNLALIDSLKETFGCETYEELGQIALGINAIIEFVAQGTGYLHGKTDIIDLLAQMDPAETGVSISAEQLDSWKSLITLHEMIIKDVNASEELLQAAEKFGQDWQDKVKTDPVLQRAQDLLPSEESIGQNMAPGQSDAGSPNSASSSDSNEGNWLSTPAK